MTGETPLVNTAETRNQMTLQTDSFSTLPLAGRSYISLATLAPGVSGLGTMGGGQPGGAGTRDRASDNYSTETAVDVSANGQGTVANQFIIDGLNVTSGIRQGVLNLTPNPDAIQETSVQVNTFSSEYGGGSSIQMASTTKSGSDQFHGLVSDYYNNESMFAKTVFMGPDEEYNPFHSNNFSFTVGGPIVPQQAILLLFLRPSRCDPRPPPATRRSSSRISSSPTGRRHNYPDTFGTHILNTYEPSAATISGVSKTASGIFPATCGTPATNNLPCDLRDDRLGDLQFEQLPRRRPVLRADRQTLQGRPDLRQRVLDEPALRRPGGHSRSSRRRTTTRSRPSRSITRTSSVASTLNEASSPRTGSKGSSARPATSRFPRYRRDRTLGRAMASASRRAISSSTTTTGATC